MIEAEMKARVSDPDTLRDHLRRLADEELSVYRDTYYDRADRDLTTQGRELRVRVAETGGVQRVLLTYKDPPADEASGSKPEHETTVADAPVIDVIFQALGLEHLVSFEKHFANYRFTANWGKLRLRTRRPGRLAPVVVSFNAEILVESIASRLLACGSN